HAQPGARFFIKAGGGSKAGAISRLRYRFARADILLEPRDAAIVIIFERREPENFSKASRKMVFAIARLRCHLLQGELAGIRPLQMLFDHAADLPGKRERRVGDFDEIRAAAATGAKPGRLRKLGKLEKTDVLHLRIARRAGRAA